MPRAARPDSPMSQNNDGSPTTRSPRPRPPSPDDTDDHILLRELRALVDGLREEVAALREQVSDLRKKPSARLSPDETADRLGISRRTLDKLEARGEIATVEVGGQLRYEAREIADYIRRNRRGNAGHE